MVKRMFSAIHFQFLTLFQYVQIFQQFSPLFRIPVCTPSTRKNKLFSQWPKIDEENPLTLIFEKKWPKMDKTLKGQTLTFSLKRDKGIAFVFRPFGFEFLKKVFKRGILGFFNEALFA
jgi:hypothetical protein